MQIHTPFITPVAYFEAPHLIDVTKDWFVDDLFYYIPDNHMHTTLKNYTKNASDNFLHRKVFEATLKTCVKDFCEAMGYNISLYNILVNKIWLNTMTDNSSHRLHAHYGSTFSGCFYVEVPENSGVLNFQSPRANLFWSDIQIERFTPFNAKSWFFNPKAGDIFLWESHLCHEVPKLNFDGVRKSIAFDVTLETINS